jgi:hypothetical protein
MSAAGLSRDEVQRRITERLSGLDDESLLRLDAISQYAAERARSLPLPVRGSTAEAMGDSLDGGVSRRRFLIGAGAGGLALAGTALGGALIGSGFVAPDVERLKELLKMRALVALYEELEQAGLDGLVSGGIALIGAALDVSKSAAAVVSAGIQIVDAAVLNFERLFPVVRQGIALVGGLVGGLAQRVRDVQQLLNAVTGTTRPVTDAVGKFFSDLLEKIPFGVGTNIRDLINQLTGLVGAVPAMIDGVNTNLLTPLSTDWFADDASKGLKGNLFEPVRTRMLQPANTLVKQVGQLEDNWQATISPINKVISQRAGVRKQIEAVKAGKQ